MTATSQWLRVDSKATRSVANCRSSCSKHSSKLVTDGASTNLTSASCAQLSMTRALGHNMLADFGVIPIPTVAQRELRPENMNLES